MNTSHTPTLADLLATDRQYRALVAKSERLSEARRALPPGSTRARVTTANARWARAAEARDLRAQQLAASVQS